MLKRRVSVLICFCLLVSIFSFADVSATEVTQTANVNTYTGPYVKVGEVTLPLEEFMPGSFFSKDGGPCDCHYTYDCVSNPTDCNCMRYYPTGNKETCEVDLMGVQCFGFSRLVFYKCFGFIDHSMNSSLFYSVGSLSSSQVTTESVKALLMKAAPGAHVRLSKGHSVSILTMNEDFIVIYHGNAGGDGITSEPCVVSTKRFTWEQFAYYARAGVEFVNMPYNYPDSDVVLTEKITGYYRITSDNGLHHRAETNTQSESFGVIPFNTIIEVTEVDGFWGKTVYNGKTGWVFLEYTTFYSALEISPSGNGFVLGDDGYLRATAWKMDFDAFTEHFDKQSLVITSQNGTDLSQGGIIGTGATITLSIDGKTLDTATLCLAGDANCNGILDVGDYIITRRAYFGTFKLSDAAFNAADVNKNGEIDGMDYILIKRFFFTANTNLFSDFVK